MHRRQNALHQGPDRCIATQTLIRGVKRAAAQRTGLRHSSLPAAGSCAPRATVGRPYKAGDEINRKHGLTTERDGCRNLHVGTAANCRTFRWFCVSEENRLERHWIDGLSSRPPFARCSLDERGYGAFDQAVNSHVRKSRLTYAAGGGEVIREGSMNTFMEQFAEAERWIGPASSTVCRLRPTRYQIENPWPSADDLPRDAPQRAC